MEMSRLTRDGTAEPVSRDQILGANGDREHIIFLVQLTIYTTYMNNYNNCEIYICIFVPVSLVKIVWDKSGGRTCRRPVLPPPLR